MMKAYTITAFIIKMYYLLPRSSYRKSTNLEQFNTKSVVAQIFATCDKNSNKKFYNFQAVVQLIRVCNKLYSYGKLQTVERLQWRSIIL